MIEKTIPNNEFIKPVYSNKDLMSLLNVKAELLRKLRNKGYLGYTKYPNCDKFWYTQKDLDNFLNNPIARREAWK